VKGWFLYSTRAGVLTVREPVQRLPRTVRVSADENWAELDGADGKVERVFVSGELPALKRRLGVAW
jgi:hypothetical protein